MLDSTWKPWNNYLANVGQLSEAMNWRACWGPSKNFVANVPFPTEIYGLVFNRDCLRRNKNDDDLDVQRKSQCNLVTMPNADWPSFNWRHHLPALSVLDPMIRIPNSNSLLAFRPMHLIQPKHTCPTPPFPFVVWIPVIRKPVRFWENLVRLWKINIISNMCNSDTWTDKHSYSSIVLANSAKYTNKLALVKCWQNWSQS